MRTLLILVLIAFCPLGNAQLIDPFGKITTHEIKLTKLSDGAYMGAMEWTTGGVDSLQRFVVKGLSVKAPVMVRIISKAPDHSIDLSFYKSDWGKIEAKVSTAGDKFVDKTFRTMNTAGIGISSGVAGIPYLIIVRVGLQFPSTQSLIRITDDKEEYAQHMRKLGFGGELDEENNMNSANGSVSTNTSSLNSNGFMYFIIGLLAVIGILFFVSIMKSKSPKNKATIFLAFFSTQFCIAQTNEPKLVPIEGQAEPAVFYEYRSQNVSNQTPVPITTVMNVQDVDLEVPLDPSGTFIGTRPVRLETAPGIRQLTGEEAEEVNRRMREATEEFDRNYRYDNPGEETEGDQRILPIDRDNEELDRLRRQVRQLRRDVQRLSQEDEEYEEDQTDDAEIIIYCEQRAECQNCMDRGLQKFIAHYEYMVYLQNFFSSEIRSLNAQIARGNSLASVPGAGLGWQSIYLNQVMPAVDQLRNAYSEKFDEYIASMKSDLREIKKCYTTAYPSNPSYTRAYEAQVGGMISVMRASKIMD